jgi:hypothetical protein
MNAAAPLPEFQRYQLAFTANIRDPRGAKRPRGVEARRMKVYTELLFNNTESFLLGCFPVLRVCLGQRRWTRLAREFFRVHRSHTPYFRQIPEEFLQFLQNEWSRPEGYPEWLQALAHYEWIELALSVSTRRTEVPFDPTGDLLAGVPVLNPVLANLAYAWPVQRIRPRARIAPEATHVLVYRDADDSVRFTVLNAFSARLVALLEAEGHTGRAALEEIAAESGHPDPALVLAGGAQLLEGLRAAGAVLGARR